VYDNDALVCSNLCGPIRVMPEEKYCSNREEFMDHLINDCGIAVTSIEYSY
jgi:hypothetical protein